ncbi:MAG: S8 family serine peptidase [Halobacteriovoraceae bacterium]|nr:S8 family serine peptidase [Halobacteriovoraceae bacterium]MBT5092831.1 S8 family serine peptidase [Halobacteriovoraceae bacterium]
MSLNYLKKLTTPTIFMCLLMGPSVFAKSKKRRSSLKPALLKKVLKKKRSKSSKSTISYFNEDLLKSRFVSWGIAPNNTASSINLLGAWKKFKKKKEIVVAVIDTGIDPHHPFLAKNLYVPKGTVSTNNFGLDFSKNKKFKNRPSDSHGHGTHVSGIVKSVFPSVKILTLKYYNPKASGQDNLTSTIRALKYAIDSNVDIINYSGGGPEPALEELRVLKMAEKKGILVVAAAGNEESNIDNRDNAYYPASYGLKNIITVTAHDQKLKLLSSSNYGKNSVDLAAPGYRIRSAYPHARASYLTGTSQATAFVTGVAALIKSQFPALTAAQVKEVINQSSRKEITLTTRCLSGGRLDAGNAMRLAKKMSRGEAKRSLANKSNFEESKKQDKKQGKIHYRFAN